MRCNDHPFKTNTIPKDLAFKNPISFNVRRHFYILSSVVYGGGHCSLLITGRGGPPGLSMFIYVLIYFYCLFFPAVLFNRCVSLSCRLQNPTRPVENVALTTKSLQDKNTTIEWDDGGNIGNKK